MKSMKLTKSESTATQPVEAKQDSPAYPYGLRIELNDESMKKLGLKELPEVGEEMMLLAKVVVERVSQNDTKDGKRQDMSLQITEMELSEGEEEKKEEAPVDQKFYNTDGSKASSQKPSGNTILVEL
jgi:uncharacterized transporter YbjL